MSSYVQLMSPEQIFEEFEGNFTEDGVEYNFSTVDCSKGMLDIIDPSVWYLVEEVDEDRDLRLKLLFGTYPKEIVVNTRVD